VKGELSRGEHKSLQTDRVILQPGPDKEVANVNQIYRWFVEGNLLESEIADRLNAQGILTDLGRTWTRATVREVLSNEKYIGNNVYNRRSFKLKKHTGGEQPGDVDQKGRRVRRHRAVRSVLHRARHSARAGAPFQR